MTSILPHLQAAHEAARPLTTGEVARYIPELATVDPELLAVAACTTAGELAAVGDGETEFTLQSLSKPFVYAWAIEELGLETVHAHVGVEPTGDAFDAIIQLDTANRPHNPMVNAGAIAVTGLLAGHEQSRRVEQLLGRLGAWAGRTLSGIDVPVYLSERTAGHRNRAIAHLMRHFGMLETPVEATLDLYFQQCSVLVTCRDLAVMAATLAGGGRNPLTGEQVLRRDLVRSVLAVMFTCGLYDATGSFAFEVGLPAKSGVSGGILAVAPGRFGLAAFSPRLDERGTSVRAETAIRHLARPLGLHLFTSSLQPPAITTPSLRQAIVETHAELRNLERGEVAAYVPQLAQTPPELFGLAVCTLAGEEIAVGDAAVGFTLQSAANPFTYALTAELVGLEEIHRHVGVEPSGNPFNAIVFNPSTHKPFNPLTNAGAIATCSRVPGVGPTERLRRLLEGFAAFAGEERSYLDAAVFLAEKAAGERNRAIACLLRNFGHLEDEEAALELYLQQCSIRTDCRRLARMGAALAAGGVAPTTGRRVVRGELVPRVLSLMATCGLHDESGRFAFEVGLPAKSGISGCLVAVVPGRMGIAVYSPRVNRHGTSVRGLEALRRLSQRLGLSVFEPAQGVPG